jgi:hypothetical protein
LKIGNLPKEELNTNTDAEIDDSDFDDIIWDDLLESIEMGNCVLFVGQDISYYKYLVQTLL